MPPEDKLKVDIDPIFKGQGGVLNKPIENTTDSVGVYNVLTNQQYTPSEPSIKSNPVTPNTPSKVSIRTYKDDIQEAIQANHLSSINMAVAENDRLRQKIRGQDSSEPNKDSKSKIKIFLFILIGLIIIGGIVYLFINNQNQTTANNAPVFSAPAPLITVEYRSEFNTTKVVKDRIINALSSQLNDTSIPLNNIYSLFLTSGDNQNKQNLTASELFKLLGFGANDSFVRNLKDNFILGSFSFAQNIPFLILQTNSFEVSFAGLLDWEKSMEKDFSLLFKLPTSPNGGLDQALTPTASHKFEDGVIVNQDVRLLKDSDGKIVFVYGLINKESIIITTNEMGFKELVTRLNREKTLKR